MLIKENQIVTPSRIPRHIIDVWFSGMNEDEQIVINFLLEEDATFD